MKIFKRVLLVLIALILVTIIGALAYIYSTKTSYKGEVHIDGVKAEVYYDNIGVPHIISDTEEEATVVLGYVHAKDRLWQMELMRRIAASRLSEIFGEDALEADMFFAKLDMESAVQRQIDSLDKDSKVYKNVEAYLKGVNTFINEGKTPIEFTLLGIEKENYTLKDVLNVYAYMSYNFDQGFKTEPLLTSIRDELGEAYLEDLAIDYTAGEQRQRVYEPEIEEIAFKANRVFKKIPIPQFVGSNGWVIGAKKSRTGKVIFTNDPHIGFSQPTIWYQAHVKTLEYERYGNYIALIPFPLLGHNAQNAYGITMFKNDDIDFYQLEAHPTDTTQYKYLEDYKSYSYKNKTINIKGKEPITVQIKKSHIGAIVTSQLEGWKSANEVAMDWVYTNYPEQNNVLEVNYDAAHANNLEEFEDAVSNLVAPGLNFVYGDADDNFALFSAAQLYRHTNGVNTQFVLNGSDSTYLKKEWLDWTSNPKAINPPEGYIYTANHQPDSVRFEPLIQGHYLPEDRARQIEKLIKARRNISVAYVKNMLKNTKSDVQVEVKNAYLKGIDIEKFSAYELLVIDKLLKWRGESELNDVGITIFSVLDYLVHKNALLDELGEEKLELYLETTLKDRTKVKLARNRKSVWWDNIHTDEVELREDIVEQSLKEAVVLLQQNLGEEINEWKWGKVHTLTHEHALGVVSPFDKLFNVKKQPISGSNEVVNNMMFEMNEGLDFKVYAGPSSRRIVDFSDIDNSYTILPTGQSGNFLSPFYKNQAEAYNRGDYYKMIIDEDIITDSKLKIEFK